MCSEQRESAGKSAPRTERRKRTTTRYSPPSQNDRSEPNSSYAQSQDARTRNAQNEKQNQSVSGHSLDAHKFDGYDMNGAKESFKKTNQFVKKVPAEPPNRAPNLNEEPTTFPPPPPPLSPRLLAKLAQGDSVEDLAAHLGLTELVTIPVSSPENSRQVPVEQLNCDIWGEEIRRTHRRDTLRITNEIRRGGESINSEFASNGSTERITPTELVNRFLVIFIEAVDVCTASIVIISRILSSKNCPALPNSFEDPSKSVKRVCESDASNIGTGRIEKRQEQPINSNEVVNSSDVLDEKTSRNREVRSPANAEGESDHHIISDTITGFHITQTTEQKMSQSETMGVDDSLQNEEIFRNEEKLDAIDRHDVAIFSEFKQRYRHMTSLFLSLSSLHSVLVELVSYVRFLGGPSSFIYSSFRINFNSLSNFNFIFLNLSDNLFCLGSPCQISINTK